MAKLTPKQERFVNEYLVDLNATAAAKRAGDSEKTAKSQGQRLLTNVDIQAAIQKRRAKLQGKLEITQEQVLEELAAIAFANGADFATVSQNGIVRITPTSELSEGKRKAIASMGPFSAHWARWCRCMRPRGWTSPPARVMRRSWPSLKLLRTQ